MNDEIKNQIKSNKFSWIRNINPPTLMHQPQFLSIFPLAFQLNLPLLRQPTKPLQALIHGVMHAPPPRVRHIAGVDPLIGNIPVAVIVSVTEPRLQPQKMYRVHSRWVRPEQLVLHRRLIGRIGPEILQKIHPPRQPVPPHEHLVQEPLIAPIVRNYLLPTVHQHPEGAIRRLDHHYTRIEDRPVVARRRHLGETEKGVEVA